jgi:hypothetical protein
MCRAFLSFIVVFMTSPITIRPSNDADDRRLRELAELDSAPPIAGPVLIAELDERPVAAISVDGMREIADPFVRTVEVVELLRAARAA